MVLNHVKQQCHKYYVDVDTIQVLFKLQTSLMKAPAVKRIRFEISKLLLYWVDPL